MYGRNFFSGRKVFLLFAAGPLVIAAVLLVLHPGKGAQGSPEAAAPPAKAGGSTTARSASGLAELTGPGKNQSASDPLADAQAEATAAESTRRAENGSTTGPDLDEGGTKKGGPEPTIEGALNPQEREDPGKGAAAATTPTGAPDPLGTGAKAGDLSETAKGRARMAAASYVWAVYGYTGSKLEDYQEGITSTVVSPDFFRSEGGKTVGSYEALLEAGSAMKGQALLEDYAVEKTAEAGKYVTGTVRFFLTAGGADGSIRGSGYYQERLTLVRWGATFRVLGAEGPQGQAG